jgi:hypothetical protein
MMFEILWPEHRYVPAATIAVWFSDAVANGELSEAYASDPEFVDNPEAMARELHSLGTITLGRGRR